MQCVFLFANVCTSEICLSTTYLKLKLKNKYLTVHSLSPLLVLISLALLQKYITFMILLVVNNSYQTLKLFKIFYIVCILFSIQTYIDFKGVILKHDVNFI